MRDDYKILKPARPGLRVVDPITKKPLAEEGEKKPWYGRGGTYWRRRFKDGDVVEVPEKPKAAKKLKGDS
jgi:hypothetical protein